MISKMLFLLLTINGNDQYKTSYNRNLGCEPIRVIFGAPLESKTELPIELLAAV